jgi:hypothetical protein
MFVLSGMRKIDQDALVKVWNRTRDHSSQRGNIIQATRSAADNALIKE